jgi:hypothetical protein
MAANRMIRNTLRLGALAAMGFAASAMTAEPGAAQSALSTVKKLDGAWRGSGTVTPTKGGRERISCRVNYNVKVADFTQRINCSGTDYRVNVNGNMNVRGNNITGSWRETVRNYSGNASGTVSGNKINVRISGVNFTGRMNITISGNRQTVSITRYDVKTKKFKNLANITLRR